MCKVVTWLLLLSNFSIILFACATPAQQQTNLGDSYYQQGHWTEAINAYDKATELDPKIEKNPNLAMAYAGRAKDFILSKQCSEAIADSEKAITIDRSLRISSQLAEAYVCRAAQNNEKGDYIQAIADYRKALEVNPQLAPAVNSKMAQLYFSRAETNYATRKYTDSIADFSKAIELSPDNSLYLYRRGLNYIQLRQWTSAINDINQACQLEPSIDPDLKLAEAYVGRGVYYNASCKINEAKTDINKAIVYCNTTINNNPKSTTPYRVLGIAYMANLDFNEAISNLDKVIGMNPNDAQAYSARGSAYFEKGNNSAAISDLDTAIKLDPTLSQAYSGRGMVNGSLKNLDQSIKDLDKAIQLDPYNYFSYFNRARTYNYKMSEKPNVSDINLPPGINPTIASMMEKFLSSNILSINGENAIKDFDVALLLNPEFTLAYFYRGITYIAMGQGKNGIPYLQKFVEISCYPGLTETARKAIQDIGSK